MSYYNNANNNDTNANPGANPPTQQPFNDTYNYGINNPSTSSQMQLIAMPASPYADNDKKQQQPPGYFAVGVNDNNNNNNSYNNNSINNNPNPHLSQHSGYSPMPYSEPSQQQQPSMTLTTTTTINTPIPHYQFIDGVVDLVPPTYMTSVIPRDILTGAEPLPYSRDLYESDDQKTSCPGCCDMFTALIGIVGIGLVLGFVALIISSGFGPWFIMAVFGGMMILVYIIIWFCCTYLCCTGICGCCGDNGSQDQMCLSAPYFSAVFRGGDSNHHSMSEALEQLSTDIPQLQFHVQCSHSTGSGKNRRTVITYSQTHTIPILHFKNVGSKNQFLQALDEYVSGDVAIQFIPKLILHPSQHDYIARFRDMVYQSNKHRDTNTTVTGFIRCVNLNPIKKTPNTGTLSEVLTFIDPSKTIDDDDLDLQFEGDIDREVAFRRKRLTDEDNTTQLAFNLATSLGNHTEIYRSNGKSSNAILSCITAPFCWTMGILSCMASCCICFWFCRFNQARYHSTFHVLFPEYQTVLGSYQNNMELYYTKDPIIQPPQMPLGQNIHNNNSYNSYNNNTPPQQQQPPPGAPSMY